MRFLILTAALAALLVNAGCTTLSSGNTAFGDTTQGLATVANIEYYSSDQAFTEGTNQFNAGNYGQSATLFKRAVELNPSDAEALLGLAASYDRIRRFDLADRAYAKLYSVIGGTIEYYNNVGYSYLLRGDLVSARQNFLKAYEIDPNNVVVNNNLKLLGSSVKYAQR